MKIAHFSDLHYSPDNLVEADRCFSFAVDHAIKSKCEVAVVSGDATDHQLQAHSPAFLALGNQVQRLSKHCPVLLLQGTFSHEPAGMLHVLQLIGAKYPIYVADEIGMVGLQANRWVPIRSEEDWAADYDLVVTCVPTVSKADLAALVGPAAAAEEMGNYLANLLAGFAKANGYFYKRGIPTTLVTHGTVDSSRNENGVPMAGLDHEFTTGALFAAGADAVMIGHIHLTQSWERSFEGRRQLIAYPGSIGRFHYGQLGETSYLFWNLLPGIPEYQTIHTPSRRMVDLEFFGVPDLQELAQAAGDCVGAFVRVRYQVDEEFAKTVDRKAIKEILKGAAEVVIEGKILPIEREKRSAGISIEVSMVKRLERWAELTNTPTDGLAGRVEMAQQLAPDEIVRKFLAGLQNKLVTKIEPDPPPHEQESVQEAKQDSFQLF